jgi:hypothetical protein
MQSSIQYRAVEHAPADHAQNSRFRTVTGNRFPRKCSCGCGQPIPRDPEVRYVVDFGAPRPYPAYLREHSPDFGSPFNRRPARKPADDAPAFIPASAVGAPAHEIESPGGATPPSHPADPAHADSDASPSPQAGRPWASGQLVFNAGQFESARSGFADYAREGETAAQLRARVNRVILEDLEAKVIALRALHEKLRDRLEGASFGDVVARGRPL